MRNQSKKLALLLSLFLLLIPASCNDSPQENQNPSEPSPELNIIIDISIVLDMFMTHATVDAYGDYVFEEQTLQGNMLYNRSFKYKTSYKKFLCSLSVYTNNVNGMYLYDYSSAVFSWGDLKNGYFSHHHSFANIAEINIEYSNIKFNPNQTIGTIYTYTVAENTFINLTEKSEIDEYAKRGYLTLEQAIIYCQSIFYKYNIYTNLW